MKKYGELTSSGSAKSLYHFSPALIDSLNAIGCHAEDIIQENKTKSVINAYKCKTELKRNASKKVLLLNEQTRIFTDEPIKRPHEGKYNHAVGALINPLPAKLVEAATSSTQKRHYNLRTAAAADADTSSVHKKLSSVEYFPKTYKNKFDENSVDVAGNLVSDPRKAISLLKGTSTSALTIPGRAADFSSEVNWRMQLRNG